MARILILVVLSLGLMQPGVAGATKWSLDYNYGRYYPELEQWRDHYGRDRASYFSFTGSYRWFDFLELGLDAGRMHDRGNAVLASTGTSAGDVEFEIYPVTAQAQFNLRFAPGQWVVPYAAIGITQLYYRQVIVGQGKATGSVGGQMLRAGLALNLNILDSKGASYLRRDLGISHIFLLLERRRLEAEKDGVELGGDINLLGLRFEF